MKERYSNEFLFMYFPYIELRKKYKNYIFIEPDPSLEMDFAIYSKNDVGFKEVLFYILYSKNRKNYIVAISLIYWKYFNDFYNFLSFVSKKGYYKIKYSKKLKQFYKRVLKRWLNFIRYSDDTIYIQNRVFIKMESIILQIIKN